VKIRGPHWKTWWETVPGSFTDQLISATLNPRSWIGSNGLPQLTGGSLRPTRTPISIPEVGTLASSGFATGYTFFYNGVVNIYSINVLLQTTSIDNSAA
jgi:hypothetical protein